MTAQATALRAPLVAPDSPHPEAAFIERLVAGDERAFRELYETYSGDVYRLGRRFVHSDAEAEEVVQEVFVSAFRYIQRFRGQSRLKTWLYRITVNRALKRRRWWTRRREVSDEPLQRHTGSGIAPERLAADRQSLAIVERCLAEIEVRKRTVLVLHEIEGLDTKAIAEIMECPRSTVLTRLSRARAELVRRAGAAGVTLGSPA